MTYRFSSLILTSLLLISLGIQAQSTKTSGKSKKAVVQVNQMDVIYYDDDEYSGIIIDQSPATSADEQYMYGRTPSQSRSKTPLSMPAPPPPLNDYEADDDPDNPDDILQPIEDEGAESEDEILKVSFDQDVIHTPKIDINQIDGVLSINLLQGSHGKGFAWPTPLTARPSSHFGPRRRRFHYGLDLAAPTGEPISAMFDGVVRISKYNRSYGNLIVIHHYNGLETYYAHLSARNVTPGDVVHAGDIIGLCGNTGRSYGSHLHLEIRYGGNAMNPEHVIDCATHDLISPTLNLTRESFRKKADKRYASNAKRRGNGKSGNGTYRVRSGDTLGKIAQRNGTTINKLCQLNGISRNSTLQIGQRLKLR